MRMCCPGKVNSPGSVTRTVNTQFPSRDRQGAVVTNLGRSGVHRHSRGVTLMEMLVVVTLLSLLAGISYPSLTSSIESLRINGAAEEVAALWNASLTRVERRQQPVELVVMANGMTALSADQSFRRGVELPDGVTVVGTFPILPMGDSLPRRYLVDPGGAAPRAGVVLVNRRGDRRLVRVEPVSGVARVIR